MLKKKFYSNGLKFKCTQCSHCCRHEPGYVFLTTDDLLVVSAHLKILPEEFIKKYCELVDLGIVKRVSIKEKDNFDCFFWDKGCTIYEARPVQCRTYPFWPQIMESKENWDREALECPGIGQGRLYDKKEIEELIQKRIINQPLSIDI